MTAPVDTASIVALVNSTLGDRKAADINTLDIAQKSDFADHMVIASGTSSRHVASLAQHIVSDLKSIGLEPRVEGLETCEWVLVDAGNVVIHLFHPDARDYYRLEKMWAVPSISAPNELELAGA